MHVARRAGPSPTYSYLVMLAVGLVPEIKRLAHDSKQTRLAISLHAANDHLRFRLMPATRRYPLKELLDVCKYHVRVTGRRITFEWALMKGINDSMADLHQLGQLLSGMLCHVNLIPINPVYGTDGSTPGVPIQLYEPPHRRVSRQFVEVLALRYRIPATRRVPRGVDIGAGCGQLAVQQFSNMRK